MSQNYFVKTIEAVLSGHRKESLHLIVAATFLIVSSRKEDGTRRKIGNAEKKRVIDAFDERFSSKELNDWVRVIEDDLTNMNWFEENPLTIAEPGKRKAENEGEKAVKLAKNISGVGNMVSRLRIVLI